jgi:hypothetical protein
VCCLTSSIKKRRCIFRHSRENGNPDPSTWIPFFNSMTDTVRHLIPACAGMTRAPQCFSVLDFAMRWRGRIGRPVTIASDQ